MIAVMFKDLSFFVNALLAEILRQTVLIYKQRRRSKKAPLSALATTDVMLKARFAYFCKNVHTKKITGTAFFKR